MKRFKRYKNKHGFDFNKFMSKDKDGNRQFDIRGWGAELAKLQQDPEPPTKESEVGYGSGLLFWKADSEYAKIGKPIDVVTSPYEQILPSATFYPIAERKNVRASGEYMGVKNLDGGVVDQLNISEQSVFMDYFDSFYLRLKGNYRYLPILSTDTKRGSGISKKMIEAVSEFLQIAQTTTFTSLNYLNYFIKTDMPINGVSDYTKEYSCRSPEGIFASLVIYQTLLQTIANLFNQFNKMRANNGVAQKMCWDKNTPDLNKLFSLFKKNALLDQFKGISSNLYEEYFDREWMTQWNLLSSINSRLANCITEPLLEVSCNYNIPKFKIYIKLQSGTTSTESIVISSDMLNEIVIASTVDSIASKKTYDKALDYMAKRLSLNDILYWARNELKQQTAQERFNELVAIVDVMDNVSSLIKRSLGDLRTMCAEVNKVGRLKWTKKTLLSLHESLYDPTINNFIVNDIYRSIFTGADSLQWNNDTLRWTIPSLWDYYKGIPDYDRYSGGSFLTFSLKNYNTDDTNAKEYLKWAPVLISGLQLDDGSTDRSGFCYAVNRKGMSIPIISKVVSNDEFEQTTRLSPLTNKYNIRVPVIYSTDIEKESNARVKSVLLHCALKVFKMVATATITPVPDKPNDPTVTVKNVIVDPDLLAIIPIELESIATAMISYSRTQGPIITNELASPSMGFFGITNLKEVKR